MDRTLIASVLAAGLVTNAAMAINLEYGHEYEVAYLEHCEADHPARVCRCSMEGLQQQVGFEDFAAEVDRYRHRVFDQSDLADEARDHLARCSAVGSLQ